MNDTTNPVPSRRVTDRGLILAAILFALILVSGSSVLYQMLPRGPTRYQQIVEELIRAPAHPLAVDHRPLRLLDTATGEVFVIEHAGGNRRWKQYLPSPRPSEADMRSWGSGPPKPGRAF